MKYDDTPEADEHTEITLSNTTLLLIFLGVAIICGVFFGFGYSIGKRSSAPQVATAELPPPPTKAKVEEAAPMPTVTTEAAPVALPPAAVPTPVPVAAPTPAPAKPSAAAVPVSTKVPPVQPAPVAKQPAPVVKQPAAMPAPAKVIAPAPVKTTLAAPSVVSKPIAKTKPPATPKTSPPTPSATAEAAPTRTYVVQVAAVSHQADADTLIGALRRKGYQVNSYPGSQDSLIHVQVGPFSSQKDASAMKDRLSNDGYLAIVK